MLYVHGSNTTSCVSKGGSTTTSKGLIVGIDKSDGMAGDIELMCSLEVFVDNVVCLFKSLLSHSKFWSKCNGPSTSILRWEIRSGTVS